MILKEPNEHLYEICRPFDFDKDMLQLDAMWAIYDVSKMQGLAANQTGMTTRCMIIRIKRKPTMMINPKIVARLWDVTSVKEGCESVTGRFNVKRPLMGLISYKSETGKTKFKFLTFRWMRIFSHELDHLNGVLISKKGIKVRC